MSALNKSIIHVSDIDDRLRMMLRVRMRLLHFDPPSTSPLQAIATSTICSDHAKELTKNAVTQAAALVKNSNRTLPLNTSATKTLAIIGPNAKLTSTCQVNTGTPKTRRTIR